MNTTSLLIAALIVLPAATLVGWVWFAMGQVEAELSGFAGYEGMHLES